MKDLLISSPTPSPRRLEDNDTKEAEKAERDVVLAEARPMLNVAVKRVERARRNTVRRNNTGRRRARFYEQEDEGTDEEEYDDDGSPRRPAAVSRNTSNHYTLNMPSPALPTPDMPYVLLG